MNSIPTDEGDTSLSFYPLQQGGNYGNTIISYSLLQENIEREVARARNDTLDLLLTLTLPDDLIPSVSVTLCCVIDVSGSMSGEPLALVKKAMNYIIDNLTSRDYLILISFDDKAQIDLPATRQDLTGKAAALKILSSLATRGGTDIVVGLNTGITAVKDVLSKNTNIKTGNQYIFLLTDGEDSNKITDTENPYDGIVKSANAIPCPIYTYGFGSSHDSKVLGHIANATNASFTYVENMQTINVSFTKAIKVVTGVITNDMVLIASVPKPATGIERTKGKTTTINADPNRMIPYEATVVGGVKLSNVRAGSFPYRIHNDTDDETSDIVVKVGTVGLSEWRQILLSLNLPAVLSNELVQGPEGVREATHWVLDTQVRFTELSTNKEYISPIHHIVIRRIYEDNAGIEYLKMAQCFVCVEVARIRAEAMKAVDKAVKNANAGKFAEAQKALADVLKLIKANPLYNRHEMPNAIYYDVDELSRRISSSSSWARGGSAQALSFLSTHSTQRSTDTALLSGKLYITKEQERILTASNLPTAVIATSGRSSGNQGTNNTIDVGGISNSTSLRSNDTFVDAQRYQGMNVLPDMVDQGSSSTKNDSVYNNDGSTVKGYGFTINEKNENLEQEPQLVSRLYNNDSYDANPAYNNRNNYDQYNDNNINNPIVPKNDSYDNPPQRTMAADPYANPMFRYNVGTSGAESYASLNMGYVKKDNYDAIGSAPSMYNSYGNVTNNNYINKDNYDTAGSNTLSMYNIGNYGNNSNNGTNFTTSNTINPWNSDIIRKDNYDDNSNNVPSMGSNSNNPYGFPTNAANYTGLTTPDSYSNGSTGGYDNAAPSRYYSNVNPTPVDNYNTPYNSNSGYNSNRDPYANINFVVDYNENNDNQIYRKPDNY